jgi:Domain of unknown function (DUF4249)
MHRRPILLFTLAISLISCKELYDYQAETSGDYVVVEGMITDDPGPYSVTISKAVAYSNDLRLYNYNPEKETGAVVTIKSDRGEEAILVEKEGKSGTYETRAEDITGEVGHRYWLTIRTKDGDEYESSPSLLAGKPDVPNLHAAAAEKEVLDESVPGGKFVTKYGLQLSCDVDNINGADYIKIDYLTFSPHYAYIDSTFYGDVLVYTRDPLIPDTISVPMYEKANDLYCWVMKLPEVVPNILGTGHSAPGDLLKDIPVGFVNQNTAFSAIDTTFSDLPENYIISDINLEISGGQLREIIQQTFYSSYYYVDIKAYALNDTIFEYYRNLKNQTTASGKIFDPIPVELVGNLHCVSNPDKSVYGIFTAASVMKKQFYIRWAGMYTEPTIENLDYYFPAESSGCVFDEEPVFWRHF